MLRGYCPKITGHFAIMVAMLCTAPSAHAACRPSEKIRFYADDDGDGYTSALGARYCVDDAPPGSRPTDDGDCNDFDPEIHPGAEELCDGIDNDCNPNTVDCDPTPPPADHKRLNVPGAWRKGSRTVPVIADILDGDAGAFPSIRVANGPPYEARYYNAETDAQHIDFGIDNATRESIPKKTSTTSPTTAPAIWTSDWARSRRCCCVPSAARTRRRWRQIGARRSGAF